LRQVIEAGADVLRLNFSHGTDAEHQETARRIRAVSAEVGKPVAILQDLPGPKIRLGAFREGTIQLSTGDQFTITTAEVLGDQQRVSVSYARLADEVRPGQTLLLADGTVELKIEAVTPPDIRCRVIVGGVLSNHKGVAVPRGTLSVSAFTEQDRVHLLTGLDMGIDLVALSFVRSPADIIAARAFLEGHAADLPLMAKIEKLEALEAVDDLLSVVDAVMIARGDLGVELTPAEVPLVQKDLIAKAMRVAKPVITATQMLRSMVDSPHPTRAEATDVANAVLDGTDAVMLSEESAVGAYPVEAVKVMAQIARAAETRLMAQRAATILSPQQGLNTSAAIGHAACLLAHEAGAAAILCCTRTGRTAQLVAQYRPTTPIIAVCRHETTVRRLMLTWGVTPVFATDFDSIDAMIAAACDVAQGTELVAPGDRVVIVGGAPSAPPGYTDFLRVTTII
jgi:pyruvate kinase